MLYFKTCHSILEWGLLERILKLLYDFLSQNFWQPFYKRISSILFHLLKMLVFSELNKKSLICSWNLPSTDNISFTITTQNFSLPPSLSLPAIDLSRKEDRSSSFRQSSHELSLYVCSSLCHYFFAVKYLIWFNIIYIYNVWK